MSFPRHPPSSFRTVNGVREKRCGGCGGWQPHDHDHFHRHRGKPDGLQPHCKTCQRRNCAEANRLRKLVAINASATQKAREAWRYHRCLKNAPKARKSSPDKAA